MSADDEKPPLDAALRHLAEQQRRSLTSHPTPQELAAYHAGELPPEAETRLLDHLAVCRECSDLLLDLSGFADLKPPEGVPELTDEQVEQDWQALRSKMREEAPPSSPPRTAEVVPIRPVVPVPRPERSYWLPIAASLLAVLGFSFGLYKDWQMRQFAAFMAAPAISDDDVERSDGLPEISAQKGGMIVFQPDLEEDYPDYEVELVREGKVLRRDSVEPFGNRVGVLVPSVEPGEYQLLLYGIKEGKRGSPFEFSFQASDR